MKRIFSFLLLIACYVSNAQTTEKIEYYYQGKKIFFSANYERLVISLTGGESLQSRVHQIAAVLEVADTSLKQMADKRMLSAKMPKGLSTTRLKDRIANLARLSFVGFVHPVFKSPAGKDMGYGDELVVKLKTVASIAAFEDFVKKSHCSIVKKYAFADKIYVLSAGSANNFDAIETANRFYESGLFDYAEPNLTLFDGLMAVPNDPLYNYQWGHNNTGSAIQYSGTPGVDMKVQQAWDITKGAGIKIAVIDEGVDLIHPDLQANLLQGFDAVKYSSSPGDGKPLSANNGHGTACAGIIAAIANNNLGIAGVAPESKIIPINVVMSNGIFTSYGGIAAGFDYAWQSGADVISNSWGGGSPSSVLDDAINRAVTLGRSGKGCVVLFASGNSSASISYPSSNTNVICVGGSSMCGEHKTAVSCDGENWWGANYGPGLDIVAPCVKIATTDISSAGGYNSAAGTAGDYLLEFNGTSSATPNAAGVAALILAANNNLSANQATTILESSCTKLSSYNYSIAAGQPNGTWNNETGHGMVNALNAVQAALAGFTCSVQIKADGPTRFCGGGVNLSVVNPEAGTTYQWRKDGINFSTGAAVNAQAGGSYDVVATAANGCVANVAPIIVANLANAAPLIANAGAGIFIDCLTPKAVKLGGNPVADKGAPFLPEKRVYGMDWFTNNFVRFSLTDPLHFETVASNMVSAADYQAKSFFTGGDFTPYGYYAIAQNTNRLVKIDTSTGVQQLIGVAITPGTPEKPKYWSGLTWDQSTKTLYALASGEDSSSLYTIDPFTAAASFVTAVPLGRIFWLTANKQGELYGFHAKQRTVCRIDKNTGAISLLPNNIGITLVDYVDPVAFAGRQDADFDPVTDELYLTALVTAQIPDGLQSSDLRKIAPDGQSTIIGPLGFFAAVDATGIAGPGYQYQWSPATGLSSTTVAVPVANPTSTTTYTLTVTDMCGNTASSQVTVHVNITKPPLAITASADSICGASSVRLSATANNGYVYQWFKDGVAINNAADSFYIASQSGNYTVKAILGGCDSLSRPFVVTQCQELLLNNNDPVSVCDTRFYDSGGSMGNYSNGSFTKTIIPATPGNLIQLTIDSFDLDNGDLLGIYEGSVTSTSRLIGILTGNSNAPKTYISKLGSLTVEFLSNGTGTSRGWFGRINCYQSAVYRSKKTGVYADISTWEVKSGAGFVNATVLPSIYDDSIIIRTGHTVTIDIAVQLDQLLVEAGAVLRLSNTLNLYDGPGDDLVVNGTLEMSGKLNINSGTMRLNGNLLAITAGSDIVGRVDVAGNAQQTITMGVALNGGWLNITNPLVTINLQANSLLDQIVINNGGKVTLSGGYTLFISRMLTLTSGKLIVTADDSFLKINPGGTIAGGNASSFVEGPLARATDVPDTHTLFFPIGKDVYRPAWIELTPPSSGIVYVYQAQVFNGAPPGRVLPVSLAEVSGVRYLKLDANIAPRATEKITLNYGPDDGVQDASTLRIAKDDVYGNWIDLGGTGATNGTGNISSGLSFQGVGLFVLAKVTPTVPSCVTNISPINGSTISTATTASLSWNAVATATSYDIYIWTGATAPLTPAASNSTGATYSATGLIAGTLYNWYVVPKNTSGSNTACATSNTTTFTTAAAVTLPACVTNTLPANGSVLLSQTSARLSWPASAGAVSYNVYLAAGNGVPTLLATNTAALTYYATGLTAGTLYSWYVAPGNDNGVNTACGTTNKSMFTTAVATGGGNISPVSNAGSNTSITLPVSSVTLDGSASYDPDGRIVEHYWYQIQGPSAAISNPFSMTPTISGLSTTGNYIIGLQVKDNNGITAYAQTTITVNPAVTTLPGCATNSYPVNGTTFSTRNAITLMWGVVNNATSYDVYFWTGATAPTTPTASNVIGTSYDATGLTASTLYNWFVVPKSAGGPATGCSANATTFTIDGPGVPPACVINTTPIIGGTLLTQTTARLVWPASSSATSYDVYLAAGNAVPTMLLGNTTALTYYATNLTPGTLYSWYIAPRNAAGANTACAATNKTTFTTAVATGGGNLAPVANAGINAFIILPASSLLLDASASYDPDGRIIEYYWYQIQGPSATISNPFSMTPAITGLTTAGTYIIGLQVKDDNGVTAYSQTTITVNSAGTDQVPACVTNISPANNSTIATQISATLTWSASPGATSYEVYFAPGTGVPTKPVFATPELSFSPQGITAGATYTWYIVPRNANGTNTSCAVSSISRFTAAPPGNLPGLPNAGGDTTITLGSSARLDASASTGSIVQFYWYQISGPAGAIIVNQFSAVTSAILSSPGIYVFGLQVKDNNGVLKYAAKTVTVNPVGPAPACVTNTSPAAGVTLTTQNTATLTWPSSATAISYDVYLAAGIGTPASLVTNTTSLTYSASGLTAGTLYSWYIAPRNASGANTACGASNTTTFTTAAALPACVTNTLPANGSVLPSQTSARLSWPVSAGAASYDVYLAPGNAVPTLLATNTTALTYYATGLTAGSLYSWYIAPRNANGANTACGTTNRTTFTTAVATGGANISPVSNAGSNTSITLPVSNITLDGSASYDPDGRIAEFYWYQIQAPVAVTISTPFSMTPTITGLTTAGNYIIGLQVKDNNGVTAYSQITVTVNAAGTTIANKPSVQNTGAPAEQTVTGTTSLPVITGSVSPNPVAPGRNARVQINSDKNGSVVINIVNVNGYIISTLKLNLVRGVNTTTIGTTTLAQGLYILNIAGGYKPLNLKLLVE